MAQLPIEGNPNRPLKEQDYKADGQLKTTDASVALVVGCAVAAEAFISNKQWNLLWRDSDLLYQSPRPMSVYENTYILEPNVQRFTVAKIVNSIVPQLYKGLFYDDPPLLLRPMPGTEQASVDAKTSVFSYLLNACNFKRNTKWGLEQMAHLGTGVWKWGIRYEKIQVKSRKPTVYKDGDNPAIPTFGAPDITREYRIVPRPFFEWRPLDQVFVDPNTRVGDAREARWIVDIRNLDFYELLVIKQAIEGLPEDSEERKGWSWPGKGTDEDLKQLWMPPVEQGAVELMSDSSTHVTEIVHHSLPDSQNVTPDLLRKKMEVLEYWDKGRKIMVLDRRKAVYSGKNPFAVAGFQNPIPFLSANWWNRPKAFYGMGLGLIVGQNQRVDQGTINAILKILSFGVNPIYLRRRDANTPTQMIRTGVGRILTVDVKEGRPVSDAYGILEQPKVPTEVWSALSESEKATESSSGADAQLVQGSSAGPRSSMGRTAAGASQLGAASATRLDGPLDNFIEQVFQPFLYILDDLVFEYIADSEIKFICGEELGKAYQLDLARYHEGKMEFEVLAGASLSAKRIMAQSLTLITQIFENPQIQQNLAEINGEYIDFKPILSMWMEASEWKNRNDIIKKLTPEMKQAQQQKSAAAQANGKLAGQQQLNTQKAQLKSQQADQDNQARVQRDIVRESFRNSAMSEATLGEPSAGGLEGSAETDTVE
jgi:hypothetical protein